VALSTLYSEKHFIVDARTPAEAPQGVEMLKEFRLRLDRIRAKHKVALDPERSGVANRRLEFYTKVITKLVDAERCHVLINDPVQHRVWLKAGSDITGHAAEVPDEDSMIAKVIRTGEPLIVAGLDQAEEARSLTKSGATVRNVLCAPVSSLERQETIGVFEVVNKNAGKEFDEADLQIVKEIADHLRVDVDCVFLDQEFLRFGTSLYGAARRTIGALIIGIAALLLILFFVIFAYIIVPSMT
jgi:GAF domain-containing protein